MHSRNTPIAMAAASLLLYAVMNAIPATAHPLLPAPAGPDDKSTCTDANGKTTSSKDCDKITGDRMSTRAKEDKKVDSRSGSSLGKFSNKSAANMSDKSQSSSSAASSASTASSSTTSKAAANAKQEQKTTKKDADAISPDRMSTRSLTPPKDADKDKNTKPDAKTDATPDTTNPK